jgi:hypothetical protein
MPMMKEAVTQANWDRMEKGLPPFKVKKERRPKPEKPAIENEITINDIDGFMELKRAERTVIKNAKGIRFIGFSVEILCEGKRKPGRPKESEKEIPLEPAVLEGWMSEGDFLELVRTYRKEINSQIIKW